MNDEREIHVISPFSISCVLFWVFLGLKLAGAVAWSWWWVTCPMWAPFLFSVALFALVAVISVFADIWERDI